MRVLTPGHLYVLQHVDGDGETRLRFVQRAPLRKIEKGELLPELLPVGPDGHFLFVGEKE